MDLVADFHPACLACFNLLLWKAFHSQDPAPVNVVAVNPLPRGEIMRFNSLHKRSVVYKTAARLWAHGYSWPTALEWAEDVYETAKVAAQCPLES